MLSLGLGWPELLQGLHNLKIVPYLIYGAVNLILRAGRQGTQGNVQAG